jgi:hypothetical protein
LKKAYDSARREVRTIFVMSSVPHETAKANKCVSRETYSRARVDKHLSDTFPIKNGL